MLVVMWVRGLYFMGDSGMLYIICMCILFLIRVRNCLLVRV